MKNKNIFFLHFQVMRIEFKWRFCKIKQISGIHPYDLSYHIQSLSKKQFGLICQNDEVKE